MGHSEGKSMIYLEARCLLAIKGAGSEGVQNGSISCIALPESLPGGVRGVLAENLIAAMLDLELASGNDAMASHSQIRKASKLMLQFLPGTDFVFSGYSSMPREDNLFGGGNFDAEDLDDYGVLQRDMQVDGGLRPVTEAEVLTVRRRAALAVQAVFRELGLPPITAEEVEAAVAASASGDMPQRDVIADLAAAEEFLRRGVNGVDVIRALAQPGLPGHRRKDLRRSEAAHLRRLPADLRHCSSRRARAERRQRRQRLPGAGDRLPPQPRTVRRDRQHSAGDRPADRRHARGSFPAARASADWALRPPAPMPPRS